ncbi:MAG: hypothetical protein U1E76_17875 [Planctomycetota bacterium]
MAGTTTAEVIDRPTYNTQIRDPIATYLTITQPQLKDQIRFIVLTKDVPLRVYGGSDASVDSDLTQLFTGHVPDSGGAGRLLNPYFCSCARSISSRARTSPTWCSASMATRTGIDPGRAYPWTSSG